MKWNKSTYLKLQVEIILLLLLTCTWVLVTVWLTVSTDNYHKLNNSCLLLNILPKQYHADDLKSSKRWALAQWWLTVSNATLSYCTSWVTSVSQICCPAVTNVIHVRSSRKAGKIKTKRKGTLHLWNTTGESIDRYISIWILMQFL